MGAEQYKLAFQTARIELDRLLEQRDEVERRISQLKQTIVALAPLAEEEDLVTELARAWMGALGLTDAIREVLRSETKPVTALEVKDRLIKTGADLSGYKNALGSIHTVLRRLVESKEATAGTDKEGSTTYEWSRQAMITTLYAQALGSETPSRAVRASGDQGASTMPPAIVSDLYRSGIRGDEKSKKKN